MRVKFANAEVDVWKLRKGTVLGLGSNYVHLEHFRVYTKCVTLKVSFYDTTYGYYDSDKIDWLEPH